MQIMQSSMICDDNVFFESCFPMDLWIFRRPVRLFFARPLAHSRENATCTIYIKRTLIAIYDGNLVGGNTVFFSGMYSE